ncbi:hypothetical protein ACIBCT_02445 [Streptosporangium sp. NPDC050855]|uniref:hypothetical protein n=1 Tax=Streptosporangium sp. NPDC050855 TaxID=3366194 RepID=UPI0037A39C70
MSTPVRPHPETGPRTESREGPGTPGRDGERPGRWRAAGAVLTGIALAVAAVGLHAFGAGVSDHDAPLTWTGSVGENVTGSRFSARVKAVHAARSIANAPPGGSGDPPDGQKRVTTKGIFVIVEVGATATREPQRLGAPVLLADSGRGYEATDRMEETSTIVHPFVQPGWWTEGVAVFEIPPGELAGSRIVLAPQGGLIVEPNGPEIEIDLGLDEEAAKRLISAAKDVYTPAGRG